MRWRWPFAGRTDELEQAFAALDQPGGFVLTGHAGVGKSGLLRQVLRQLDEQRHSIIKVFATEATSSIHFGAFVHLLPPEMIGTRDPQALLAGAFGLVRDRAAGRRVVLAVDDVHLLDPLGAAFVQYAVRSGPAWLAATRRSGEPVPDPISALWREDIITSITVHPLDEAAVRLVLAELLQGRVDGSSARRLWRLSEGNALLLREIVEALVEQQAFELQHGVWRWSGDTTGMVSSTTEMIGRRVAQLPAPVRAVVELAAIAEPAGRLTVAELTSEAAVLSALDSGLVRVDKEQRREVLRVSHPLYGDVVRQRTSDHVRSAHIGRLAERLQTYGLRRRDDAMRLGIWHLDHGVTTEASTLTIAARLAYGAQDLHLAVALAEAAVAAGGGFDAVELLSSALGFSGEPARAIALLHATKPSLTDEGERIKWNMAHALILFNGLHDASCVEELRAAVAEMASDDRDILLVLAGCLEAGRGDIADGLVALTAILSAETTTHVARCHALAMTAGVRAACGEPDAARRFIELEQQLAGQFTGWPTLRVTTEFARLTTTLVSGQVADIVPAATTETLRHFPAIDVQALLTQAVAMRQRGEVREAAEIAAVASSLAEAGGGSFISGALAEVAHTAALMGDTATAATAMAASDHRYRQTMYVFYPLMELARIQLAAANPDLVEAEHLTRALVVRLRADGLHGFETHALHTLARLDRVATRDVDRLEELAGSCPDLFPVTAALHARGLLSRSAVLLSRAEHGFAALGLHVLRLEAAAHRFAALRHDRAPGAGAAADHLAGLLARTGIRALPALRLPLPRLTAREAEIAELVVAGLDPAGISGRLVIEKRSVDSHLHRVYRKLGIRSRDDLPGFLRLMHALDHLGGS